MTLMNYNRFSAFTMWLVVTTLAFGQETTTVTATGYGRTPRDAERDSLRAAVEQAIGLFIDAETLIQNEEVINDQVLSYSDGFVTSKDILSAPSKNESGLYQTTIRAVVKKNVLAEKLKEAKVTTTIVDGEDLWAEAISKVHTVEDGRKLFEKLLSETDVRKLLVARLVDDQGNVGKNAKPSTQGDYNKPGRTHIAFNIEVYYDLEAYYTQVAPRFIKLLNVIGKPVESSFTLNMPEDDRNKTAITRRSWRRGSPNSIFYKLKSDNILFAINIGRDHLGTNQRFAIYELSRHPYKSVLNDHINNLPNMEVILTDKEGNVIRQDELTLNSTLIIEEGGNKAGKLIPLAKTHQINNSYPRALLHRDSGENVYLSPDFGSNESYDTLLLRYEATLHEEDLKDLGEIRLAF